MTPTIRWVPGVKFVHMSMNHRHTASIELKNLTVRIDESSAFSMDYMLIAPEEHGITDLDELKRYVETIVQLAR